MILLNRSVVRYFLAVSTWALLMNGYSVNSSQERLEAPHTVESTGDDEYDVLVADGRKLEGLGKFGQALQKFHRALQVKRYEMPSYYVLLDIGRTQYKLGKYAEAVKSLEEYLRAIETELKVEKGEMMPPGGLIIPGHTEQSLKELSENKAEAEALLVASKSRLASKKK